MKTFTIETVIEQKESEGLTLRDDNIFNFEKSTFLVKDKNDIIGFAKLYPLESIGKLKALWLESVNCENFEAKCELLKEVAMHSWELGYDAVFSSQDMGIPIEVGFKEFNNINLIFKNKPDKLMGLGLSWNGLRKFEKTN